MFDARPPEVGSSRGFIASAALAVGLLTGFAGGYVFRGKQEPTPPVDIPAQAYTEDAVADSLPEAELMAEASPADPAPHSDPDPGHSEPNPSVADTEIEAAPPRRPSAPPRDEVTPTSAEVPPRFGSLVVLSRPVGATVYLDDHPIGTTPISLPAIRAGAHRVRMELEGHRPWETAVIVHAGASARVAASLER